MALKDALDANFAGLVKNQAAFLCRKAVSDFKVKLDTTIADLNSLTSDPKSDWAQVNAEIVSEAGTILDLLTGLQTELAKHSEFIDWVEPE